MVTPNGQTLNGKIYDLAKKLGGIIPTCVRADAGKVLSPSSTVDNEFELITPASGGLSNPTIIYDGTTTSTETTDSVFVTTSSAIPLTAKLLFIEIICRHRGSSGNMINSTTETITISTALITEPSHLISSVNASKVSAYITAGVGYFIKSDVTGEYSDELYGSYFTTLINKLAYL
jgi:hypothetical protein